ncbi:HPF/RaiA family ribosome-associated protein [Abyssibacter profundi]|uniref:30S ribosomal protein S30 n=1 Tax=Abyssibacter profundi TaxID=2182787 RepID=A0A363UKZ1_9GAMM|nr:HPF/RaiA family ribosome-associated protein [Abyssibacter profundi]MBV61348.1 30S ribosomal protein S30 [Nevskiales bacterium]PWN56067.1 30S ribosomal protein S30 [Abyssibacter profundi]
MQLDIQALYFDMTPGIEGAITRAAEQHMDRFDHAVKKLTVRVYDTNGLRGGVDKGCRIHSDLGRARALVVEAVDEDLYTAISRAFEKAERATSGRLQRQRRPTDRRLRATIRRGLEPMVAQPLG